MIHKSNFPILQVIHQSDDLVKELADDNLYETFSDLK